MKPPPDTAVSSAPNRSRAVATAVLIAGVLGLSACATPVGGVNASPQPSTATPTASSSPTESSSPTSSPEASPAPTTAPSPGAPYNGEILVVTSEVRDGNLEVTAMVPGVSETGGTCTLTVTSTGARVSVEGNEGKDVTYCGLMSIAVGADAPADLAFQVTYSSGALSAQSSIATLEPTP